MTLAFNTYDVLRTRTSEPALKKRAQAAWVNTAMKLAKKLQEVPGLASLGIELPRRTATRSA